MEQINKEKEQKYNEQDHGVKEFSQVMDIISEKVPGVLDALSKSVPELISNLLKTVYSPDAGSNMGKAVGSLYKELVDSGIPQDVAVKMASDYMLTIKDAMKNAQQQAQDQFKKE